MQSPSLAKDAGLKVGTGIPGERQVALKKIRDAGLHKKQIHKMAARSARTTLSSSVTPLMIVPRSFDAVSMTVGGRSGRQSRPGCR
jgi:hypothetical protein